MEITANAIQLVTAGNNVLFTDTVVPGNCSIIHRTGSGLIKVKGTSATQCRARFKVFFGGNIAVPTGQTPGAIQLSITIDGEPVPSTTMIVTPAAEEAYENIGTSTYFDVPVCCCSTVGVENTSTIPINIQNANLIVERVA